MNGGTSPYATGGGGVGFEWKVAVQYLAHLLTGDGASELGDGRRVTSVAFQQAPDVPVDDLVLKAARLGETQPSLRLALGIRRSPQIVKSDESTRKLIGQFVRAVAEEPSDEQEHQFGLVVAGPQPHARQLAELADAATAQSDSAGFFKLIKTPNKFPSTLRVRLGHVEKLVEHALHDHGVVDPDTEVVQKRTWLLLSSLKVLMPRLESPDDIDWMGVANRLTTLVPESDLTAAVRLRDHLVALVTGYSPQAAHVDLTMLRRDCHALLDSTIRRHKQGWHKLNSFDQQARDSVRTEIAAGDGGRSMRLDRDAAAKELLGVVSDAKAVVVSGESGVGKSALAVVGLANIADADRECLQVLCVNLRHVPALVMTLEGELGVGVALSTLLSEMSAPQRVLVIDGADATTEGRQDVFGYLVKAAQDGGVKVVAVTSIDSSKVVRRIITEQGSATVTDHLVAPLNDSEINKIVDTFSELQPLAANQRSRELLRRLVVVDLFVRGHVSGAPVTDADAMNEVWSGLVRRREMRDRGFPDAREMVLLQLAEIELSGGDRRQVMEQIDYAALDGLRRDGLLRGSGETLFRIGPDFAHDEVRRYAVARLLLADGAGDLTAQLRNARAPRWSLAAARLACQAWLGQPETSTAPLKGRFAAQQVAFDALVDEGYGSRWSDVPTEALLTLADVEPLLRDAWPPLLADGAKGLRRLVRVVKQRHSKTACADVAVATPIIALMLETPTSWSAGEFAKDILCYWLRGHILVGTPAGNSLRIRLRQQLVDECSAGDRRLAERRLVDERETAVAPQTAERPIKRWSRLRTFLGNAIPRVGQARQRHAVLDRQAIQSLATMSLGHGRPLRRRADVPREIIDPTVLELFALLGPDVGDAGAAILRRVAKDAPQHLAPVVERPLAGKALSNGPLGLLAEVTEAYYLDDESGNFFTCGVRSHETMGPPLSAWYYGPFMPLFMTDFRNGVAVLNRLLNHAARNRVREGVDSELDSRNASLTAKLAENELGVSGVPKIYIGDDHVWRWYRGNPVGPYPCMSALQALERACDQMIGHGVPIQTLILILLEDCENLAMVGLVVGVLVRHLDASSDLLDPYFVEPTIWKQEFVRIAHESDPFSADSKEVVAPERRGWSLGDAAQFLVIEGDEERHATLHELGNRLIDKKRRMLKKCDVASTQEDAGRIDQELAAMRGWASTLDRSRYTAHKAPDGVNGIYIQFTPPDDVVLALAKGQDDAKLANKALRLFGRYSTRDRPMPAIGPDELTTDLNIAEEILANPRSDRGINPLDTAALVAAAVLKSHLIKCVVFPDATLSFAVELMTWIGENAVEPDDFECETYIARDKADRTAAGVLPLLLVPTAVPTPASINEDDEAGLLERVFHANLSLAQAMSYEVRLHLARGLDHVWKVPCAERGCCHHELGLQMATGMVRHCVLGSWDSGGFDRDVTALKEPLTNSLAKADADSLLASRFDGAIRALAPATMADCCVSDKARDLLLTLLATQRRCLLHYQHKHDRNPDERMSHALVSARALLTLAGGGDDTAIYQHINALAENPTLLAAALQSLSAAAEETKDRAATAKRIWPDLVRHVLHLHKSRRIPFNPGYGSNNVLAVLVPNATGELPYLYHEVDDAIVWWDPSELRPEVEAWLPLATGDARCIDQLICFVYPFDSNIQVRVGLSWVASVVLPDPASVYGGGSFMLTKWLEETRPAALEEGLEDKWKDVVDAMIVAGDSQLTPYSD